GRVLPLRSLRDDLIHPVTKLVKLCIHFLDPLRNEGIRDRLCRASRHLSDLDHKPSLEEVQSCGEHYCGTYADQRLHGRPGPSEPVLPGERRPHEYCPDDTRADYPAVADLFAGLRAHLASG